MRAIACLAILAACLPSGARADDWPQVAHDAAHTASTADSPAPPYRIRWARQFPGELLATRTEAVVAGGLVFVGTYAGKLHALDGATGAERWTAMLDGPILHAAAGGGRRVYAATAAGTVAAFAAGDGQAVWSRRLGDDGFDTAPMLAGGLVVLGSRGGALYALDAANGQVRWKRGVGAPIRTTAACDGSTVYFAAEDMRARACDLRTGRLRWTSQPLEGQSLRDYYPVLAGGRLVLRSTPAGPFAERLTADRHVLAQADGIDDTDWRKVDAFLKSDRTAGTPEQVAAEQDAVLKHLAATPDARTFFVLDSATGKEAARAPVLYAAGCQGVGFPPALTRGGRPVVFWRSGLSNWSLGVAPLVSVGYLDLSTGRVEPIRHASGVQPPWNTFWGTADESTRFAVGGATLFLCHQGTLGGLDLGTRKLFPIAGERDTWGGYTNLPYARNEWHGPARSCPAISGDTLYWVTGSRVLAVQGSAQGPAKPPEPVPALGPGPAVGGDEPPLPDAKTLEQYVWKDAAPAGAGRVGYSDLLGSGRLFVGPVRQQHARLAAGVDEVLRGRWRPLYVQPGLAGRELFFAHSAEVFEALSLAYPVLRPEDQDRVRAYLASEWAAHPPYSAAGTYAPLEGKPRERFAVPDSLRTPTSPSPPHIARCWAVWLYAANLGAFHSVAYQPPDTPLLRRIREAWPQIRAAFERIQGSGWRLDPSKGDLYANRVVAGLIGYARLARELKDPTADEAAALAAQGLRSLVEWMRRYDPTAVERPLMGSSELDRVIGGGDGLFLAERPHRGRLARLLGITPEIAACLRDHAGPHLRALFGTIDRMMPGWYLAGEERQVHFGENLLDFPDQALAIFSARLWAGIDPPDVMHRYLDMPLCPADVHDIEKRALWLRGE